MNTIGSRIKKIREERGISQECIAFDLHLAQSSYSRLEKDDRRLSVYRLIKIAEVLNVSMSVIFKEEQTAPPITASSPERFYEELYRSQNDYIRHLKTEIEFLRNQIEILAR